MINQTTRDAIDTLWARYRELARGNEEALAEITLAEVPEAVHQSNAIESSTLTLADTEAVLTAGVVPRGLRLREVHEAQNLATVTRDLLTCDEPLSVELILRWHTTLLTNIDDAWAGRFRRAGEWVRVGGHLGAHPEFAPGLVRDAIDTYHADEGYFLDTAARFHAEFEVIHPFADGNGRIGRVVINHQLQQRGLPPVIVRAKGRHTHYYPLLDQYAKTDRHDGLTTLLALLLRESLHKRIAYLSGSHVVPLPTWAKTHSVRGNVAANKARRQTIPAFRLRDRWAISADFRP